MTSSRSLVGRNSFWWAAGFIVLAIERVMSGQAFYHTAPGALAADYEQAHRDLFFWLAAAFAIFAVVYLTLEQLRRGARRGRLGGVHAAGTIGGVVLLRAAVWLLYFEPTTFSGSGAVDRFRLLNAISAAGYFLLVVAQLLFVAVLIDALRPAPDVR